MAGITIYHKDGCIQCKMTMNLLKDADVAYTEINISRHPEYLDQLRERGFRSMPVVETDTDVWFGFRPDKVNAFIAAQ